MRKNLINSSAGLETLAEEAVQKVSEAQPWPYHFKLRVQEVKLLFELLNIDGAERMLELGCGNAFGSVLFSDKANKIVATDLPGYNLATNSIGLDYAKRLIRALNIDNISLLASQAEELPFANESFDLVFSAYVLEHLADKQKAIGEIKRILKKGGIAIAIVPNFMERLCAPLHFYPYLFQRGAVYLLKLLGLFSKGKNNTVVASKEDKAGEIPRPFLNRLKKFLKDYPNFPFCEPHGNYKCWGEEFLAHLPEKWKNLFESNGLKVIGLYSTMFVPHNFLSIFSEKVAYLIYAKSVSLTKKIGKSPIFKYIGYSLCLIVQK